MSGAQWHWRPLGWLGLEALGSGGGQGQGKTQVTRDKIQGIKVGGAQWLTWLRGLGSVVGQGSSVLGHEPLALGHELHFSGIAALAAFRHGEEGTCDPTEPSPTWPSPKPLARLQP